MSVQYFTSELGKWTCTLGSKINMRIETKSFLIALKTKTLHVADTNKQTLSDLCLSPLVSCLFTFYSKNLSSSVRLSTESFSKTPSCFSLVRRSKPEAYTLTRTVPHVLDLTHWLFTCTRIFRFSSEYGYIPINAWQFLITLLINT